MAAIPSFFFAPVPAPAPKIIGLEAPMAVVGPQFCVPYDVELVMTDNVFALDGASGVVKDSNGTVLLKLKGRWLSIHGKHWLCDLNGVHIVTLKSKIRTLHNRWHMYRGDSIDEKDLICTIKTPELMQSGPDYDIFLAGNTSNEEHCDIKLKKGYNNQHMVFYLGETAKILAQLNNRTNDSSYGLTVYVNMDYAFVVAMTTIMSYDNSLDNAMTAIIDAIGDGEGMDDQGD